MRGGTENVAGAIGLMVAAEHALTHQVTTARHTEALADLVHERVLAAVPDAQRLGHPERRLPHILSMRLPGVVGQTLLERCNARGVAFSIGSACHGAAAEHGSDTKHDAKKAAENHVLAAIGLDRRAGREVIRLSFCRDNTLEQVERAAEIVVEEALRLLQMSPRRTEEWSRRP